MSSAKSELTTAEELFLLALDPESGRVRSHPAELLQGALAGAVLMDLFQRGCIMLVDHKIVPGPDTGELWCDHALARIRELPMRRGIGFWVDAFGYEVNNAQAWTVSSLLDKGVLKERQLLGVITRRRYTLNQREARTNILAKLLDTKTVAGPLEANIVALLVCASACGVLDAAVPHGTRQSIHERVDLILQSGTPSIAEVDDGAAIAREVYLAIYSPGVGHGHVTSPML